MRMPSTAHIVSLTVTATTTVSLMVVVMRLWKKKTTKTDDDVLPGAYESMIGSTPIVELKRLSRLTGRRIVCKMESYNPGGTGKDRAALRIIEQAEQEGRLPLPMRVPAATSTDSSSPPSTARNDHHIMSNGSGGNTRNDISSEDPINDDWSLIQSALTRSRTGGLVIEGTSGSTGIALATLARIHGHACLVIVPDDQAVEKQNTLRVLGATVRIVRTVSIAHPDHYVNTAQRLATVAKDHGVAAILGDQFETPYNAAVHYDTTGPEIWKQCGGRLDAFVMSAGTGGTMAGVAQYLREQQATLRIVLVDPVGSVLAPKVNVGVAFASQQQERSLRRHRYDSVAEGIGLDRVTANVAAALPWIDVAYTISDQDAVDMAHWILEYEGLLIGCSTAMNLVGAVRTACALPQDSKVCTIVCDAGHRHMTRFWNREYIVDESGLTWPEHNHGAISALPDCIARELRSQSKVK